MQILKRAEAIALGLKWYFTGKPCKHGHIDLRQVSDKSCKTCGKIKFAKWEAKNLAKRAQDKRNARLKNPEKYREIAKKYRESDPDRYKKIARANSSGSVRIIMVPVSFLAQFETSAV